MRHLKKFNEGFMDNLGAKMDTLRNKIGLPLSDRQRQHQKNLSMKMRDVIHELRELGYNCEDMAGVMTDGHDIWVCNNKIIFPEVDRGCQYITLSGEGVVVRIYNQSNERNAIGEFNLENESVESLANKIAEVLR